jgi:hypothetical protein
MRTKAFMYCAAASAILMAACEKQAPVTSPVTRGKYLVEVGGCNDCHTPKVMDPVIGPVPDTTRLLSGHREGLPYPTWMPEDIQTRNAFGLFNSELTAWAGPWGVSFPVNLTPDKETGLGEWTEQAFIQAMRTGKHQGQPDGRPILPPMPWQGIAKLTNDDLSAVWAYLQSLPPVRNAVPLPVPPAGPGQ